MSAIANAAMVGNVEKVSHLNKDITTLVITLRQYLIEIPGGIEVLTLDSKPDVLAGSCYLKEKHRKS